MTSSKLLDSIAPAANRCEDYLTQLRTDIRTQAGPKSSSAQRLVHGLAWVGTTVNAYCSLNQWFQRLRGTNSQTSTDELIALIGAGELLAQLTSGIAMSQLEVLRPVDLSAQELAHQLATDSDVAALLSNGNSVDHRRALADAIAIGDFGTERLDDEDLNLVRESFRRFGREKIRPYAHQWHLKDQLIPDPVLRQMAELGVFGITIDEQYGGLGLGKMAMCIVSEELSRAYLTVGSLGTRSEIAGELISANGTPQQKQQWLGLIATGEVLPCAVFTEPDVGSDLASLHTRAVAGQGEQAAWQISGNKTWTTHGARSDIMTLLARTDPDSTGYQGLSMFIAPKPRGTVDKPFPAAGMSGSEIEVLGYRGMKEYEIAFDQFETPADSILGNQAGNGFKQLMQTFESARIQTASRALGVAWDVLDVSRQYALDRRQFKSPLIRFARVADKLAMMLTDTVIARELTYFAAREKDAGQRCDMQAGMAKLFAARVAWANADCGLQIHGGNGYALEYDISRLLLDARILNIFEGAAEIQAQIIGRRLLETNE